MTIICIRNGVVASDTGGFSGTLISSHDCEKATVLRSGTYHGGIIGAAGPSWWTQEIKRWAEGDCTLPCPVTDEDDHGQAVILLPNQPRGLLQHMLRIDSPDFKPYVSVAEFLAIGGPSEFAFGAMAAGATAVQAVNLCFHHTSYAAGRISTLVLPC